MGLTVVKGHFDGHTTIDSNPQVVTVPGLGGAPVCGIIWGYHTTTTGIASTAAHSYGFFASDLTQAAVYAITANAQSANSISSRAHSGSHVIYTCNAGEVLDLQAAAVSAVGTSGSDGTFTLNWTTKDATSRRYGYIIFSGSDITDATVLQFLTMNSATPGTDPITGMGFQPDALFLATVGDVTAPPMKTNNGQLSLGFTDFSSSYSVSLWSGDNESTSNEKSQADMSFLNVGWSGTDFLEKATLSSADSDGFTLNYSAVDTSERYCWVLGIKGPRFKCGTFTTNASTGSADEVTGLATDPVGLALLTGMRPNATGVQSDARIAFGASDGTNEGIAGYLAEDGQSTTDTDRFQDTTQAVQVYDHTQTLKAAGDVSFGTNKVSVNYTTADASNAYEFGYLAIMPAAAAGTTIYRGLSSIGIGSTAQIAGLEI